MKSAEHGPDLANLRELVDSLPALIHTGRPDGYLDFFNERWLEFVGLRFEDLEGWKWTAAIHPDDVDALVAKWRACLESGEPFEFESRVRRADGEYRWMLHQKLPLRNARGEIVKWYGSSVDIDDRKRAEHEVRKHETVHVTLEAQLQATLNIIPAYTWYAAPSGALTFVNERCADYLGLPSDHPLRFGIDTGAAWDSQIPLLHPDDQDESRRVWSTCLSTGGAGEMSFRVRSAEGGYRWFVSRAEPLRAKDGTLLYWIGVNLDIEERKQAEFYLAEGQRLGHTGSWAFNAAGFDYWSPELFAIHGLAPGAKAPTIAEYMALVHPEDRGFVAQEIQRMLSSDHRGFDFTKRIVRPDGDVRYVRFVGAPLIDSGRQKTIVGTAIDVTEHELLTQELRRREAYLAEAQRLSRTGSFGWRPDSGEVVWSAETYRVFGYDEEIKPTLESVVRRVHPEDRAEFQRVIDAASRSAAAHLEHTFRLLLPGERVKHVHALARSIADALEGHEFVGAVTDVTDHKLAEEALRESEENFRLVVDGIAGLVSPLTPGGDVDFVNRQVLEYFGKTFDELKNWQTSDVVHPDDHDRVVTLWANTIPSGQPYDVEYRLRRSDGMYRWFHARGRPLRDAEGAIARWYILLTDIDERKQAEQRLKEQEAELRQMLDLTPQLVGVFGPTRERLHANRMALSYVGQTLDEWRQQEFGSEIHPEDAGRLKAHAERSMLDGLPYDIEMRLRSANGTYRWFLARYNPVRDDNGQILRWYVGCTDIEDRKRAQERLEQENVALREEIDKASMFEEIVGASPALKTVLTRVSKVAASDSTVLINGAMGPQPHPSFIGISCEASLG